MGAYLQNQWIIQLRGVIAYVFQAMGQTRNSAWRPKPDPALSISNLMAVQCLFADGISRPSAGAFPEG